MGPYRTSSLIRPHGVVYATAGGLLKNVLRLGDSEDFAHMIHVGLPIGGVAERRRDDDQAGKTMAVSTCSPKRIAEHDSRLARD